MTEQFTTEELAAILRALRHLQDDYPEISDQLRQLRDSAPFKRAIEKIEGGKVENA